MDNLICPVCANKLPNALFHQKLKCTQCGTNLLSNLQLVSLVEWLIGGPIFFVIVAALQNLSLFKGWSYMQLMLLLFVPACLIHLAVVAKFVRLRVKQSDQS